MRQFLEIFCLKSKWIQLDTFYVDDIFLASNIVQLIFLGFLKGNSDLNLHCFMIYNVHAQVSKY